MRKDVNMYGLAVRQPYASLIAVGKKTIEVRSKPWKYRGPVIICASKNPRIKLESGEYLPTGAAVAIVDMVDCRPLVKADLKPACLQADYTFQELDGSYAWILSNPREIEPIPGKWIVAPWPWKGAEPVLAPGWHERIGF